MTMSQRPSGFPGATPDGYYGQQRGEMLPFIPATAERVLDVGCGEAQFSRCLKSRRSVEVWGVEVEPAAAAVAARHLDRVVQQPFSPELALPQGYFDCIVFNDVLEHLGDPWGALTFSRRLLRTGGCLVCSIPNVRFWGNVLELLVEKEWRYKECGILDRTHLRFFTQRSIVRTFSELGFRVEHIEGINPTDSRKWQLANLLLGGWLADMRYLQFAVVARPRALGADAQGGGTQN